MIFKKATSLGLCYGQCHLFYNLKIDCLSLADSCFQPSEYIWCSLDCMHLPMNINFVDSSDADFYINGVWCWLLLPLLSGEKTNYVIKQLLTIELLDMMLISPIEYHYWHQLLPQSILVFFGGYHIIPNTSIVNNCMFYDGQIMLLLMCKHVSLHASVKTSTIDSRYLELAYLE